MSAAGLQKSISLKNVIDWTLVITVIVVLGTACALLPTPTEENCYWNWAYGEGSPAFEEMVQQEFETAEIAGTVQTSSYGETYSCDHSYHACCLDVGLEVRISDVSDQVAMADLAENIYTILQKSMQVSEVPNLGGIRLEFIDESRACLWSFELKQCQQ